MPAPIEFYFDFSSPYGYLASELIDAIAERHGRNAIWHAIVLDATYQSQDRIRIPTHMMRSEYVMRDVERSAGYYGLPYKAPAHPSLHTELAARVFQWLGDRQPQQARDFAHGVFRALFTEDRNIADAAVLQELATKAGMSEADFHTVQTDGTTKTRLKAEIDVAQARGVFGSPFFIVEGERFWGVDRLPQLERWLEKGPY
ncbi:2-hydroxychromene-2-carboxylate isomerase [Ideonella azotifigens]|uniref:2-hydroxychromene-2-carboxylate isomerase n=1 Tax=Ideonella azotifigens TaxID=513160 RepID=A0ABN1K807_9BURK|nr:2-hydroxychromene-2-carboxylate isomerase [Ideonella azotifigens]MCD2342950.1 2-hydroxychromene-2-carboxylate isomerase [Ideonella azotifigens]